MIEGKEDLKERIFNVRLDLMTVKRRKRRVLVSVNPKGGTSLSASKAYREREVT
jgi:hypothetical protein